MAGSHSEAVSDPEGDHPGPVLRGLVRLGFRERDVRLVLDELRHSPDLRANAELLRAAVSV